MSGWVQASAPGKVILVGEHFVVKGSRALAASIGLRVRVKARPLASWPARLSSPALGAEARLDGEGSLRGSSAFRQVPAIIEGLKRLGYEVKPFEAVVESELPPAAGLGSSAATSAALALALSALNGEPLSPGEVSRVAYEAEKVVHGRPSGVDNTIVSYGGGLVYRAGEPPRRLSLKLPPGTRLVIAHTGKSRATGELVARVLGNAEALWPAASLLYQASDRLVDIVIDALERGDAALLGKAFDLAHGMVSALGASSMEVELLVHKARSSGALGAKLTGAGGGGCVIAVVEEGRLESVVKALRLHSPWVRSVEIGAEGARLDRKA
ncbi:mevalonate kinase [Stetteria hydrogenophila]